MKISTKWLGLTALAVAASLSLNSCGGSGGGDSSDSSISTLGSLNNLLIESYGGDEDSTTTACILSLHFTATSTGSGVESGNAYVRFSYGDPVAYYGTYGESVTYTYDSSTGVITFTGQEATTTTGSTTEKTVNFDYFTLTITLTSEMAELDGYLSCVGYQAASQMTIDGNTVTLPAQAVEITDISQ